MKRNYKKLLTAAALGAFAFAAVPAAHAVATLTVYVDGVISGTGLIYDNLASGSGGLFGASTGNDGSAAAGQVVVVSSFGGWTLTVNTGTTYPANSLATAAEINLNVTATSALASAGTLSIRFSELSYGPITGSAFTIASSATLDQGSGNAGQSVSLSSLISTANTQFAGTTLGSATVFSVPGANSNNQTSGVNTSASYALTDIITFSHNAGGGRTSSAQINVTQNAPDGGTTLSFLGCSLLGLAGLRRKLASA